MPHNIFRTHRNKEGMTSMEVFNKAHKTMLKEGVRWLTKTAKSCSVVAALIATVAYAAATTVPGGVEKGKPLLKNTYAFSIFTISSLVALCLSVTSLTMFLSILTSRNEISDFRHNLPMKCIMGLSSLFISIAAMLVSFCAGHFFDLADHLQHTAFPIYAVTCLPVSIYAATQFPLYFDLIYSIIMPVPKRNNWNSSIYSSRTFLTIYIVPIEFPRSAFFPFFSTVASFISWTIVTMSLKFELLIAA